MHVVDLAQRGGPRGFDNEQHIRVGSNDFTRIDACIAALLSSEKVGEPRRGQDQVDGPLSSSDEELVFVLAAKAVQEDRSECMPGALHRLLSDGKVTLDLCVELGGDVGHVEDLADLRDRRIHRLLSGRQWLQCLVLTVRGLEPGANAGCV